MGESDVVPRKVEKWAYGGDSIAANGYVGEGSPRNTDISTQVSKFTGENIVFDNYGRTSDTTWGMLGKHAVRGKREDTVGEMLKWDYDGIIIEVGVNDLAARGGGSEEKWEKNLARMRKNIVTMYVRTFLKGASEADRAEAAARIDSEIMKTREEEARIAEALGSERARKVTGFRSRMEKKKGILEERRAILEEAKDALKGARRMPGKPIGRMIFVEVTPWKEYASWSERKGLRTYEYNRMLESVAAGMNAALGELGGPRMEVAKVHDVLASPKDRMRLRREYRKGGDFLHFGPDGRRAVAAAIALGHFPGHIANPERVEAIALGNRPQKKKTPGALAKK